MFSNCIQNDVTSQRFSLSIGLKNQTYTTVKMPNLLSSLGKVGERDISESEELDSSSSVGLGVVVLLLDFCQVMSTSHVVALNYIFI